MRSPALGAYRALSTALEPLAPALLRARARRGKEDGARLGERLGRTDATRPPGRLVWLHGASVGEGLSLLPLVQASASASPETGLLVTSGTRTSAELLAKRLPAGVRHQYAPVDGPGAATRFLDHWRPDLCVFVESEVWPNLLLGARARGARTALVSARLSAASLKGWARAPAAARTLFGGFDLLLAQDGATADGLQRLGGLRDVGRLNLKLAGEALPADATALEAASAAFAGRPVLLAASTHPGEEAIVLEVFGFLKDRREPDGGRPLLLLVPRHPERGEAVAALARANGFSTARRGAGEPVTGATEVYLADTLGELGVWLRLAQAAFVGGSLVEGIGGHNPLEPARLGCPAISGPHVANWRNLYSELEREGAVRIVTGAPSLAGALAEALADPAALRREAERAQSYAGRQSGAVEGVAARLLALLRDSAE